MESNIDNLAFDQRVKHQWLLRILIISFLINNITGIILFPIPTLFSIFMGLGVPGILFIVLVFRRLYHIYDSIHLTYWVVHLTDLTMILYNLILWNILGEMHLRDHNINGSVFPGINILLTLLSIVSRIYINYLYTYHEKGKSR